MKTHYICRNRTAMLKQLPALPLPEPFFLTSIRSTLCGVCFDQVCRLLCNRVRQTHAYRLRQYSKSQLFKRPCPKYNKNNDLRLALTCSGKILASINLSLSVPYTLSRSSITPPEPRGFNAHVPQGWNSVLIAILTCALTLYPGWYM